MKEVKDCKKLLLQQGFSEMVDYTEKKDCTFFGVTVRKYDDIDLVLGKLYLLKRDGKIQDFQMLSLFPNNIQVYPKFERYD